MAASVLRLGLITILVPLSHAGPSQSAKSQAKSQLPLIITTWSKPDFVKATEEAWRTLENGGTRLDAVVNGCSVCEKLQCDKAVGYGGSPDETGETTLDAMVIDGPEHRIGAVANLRHIKDAVKVARAVMLYTKHTVLAGESATAFAADMGFQYSNALVTPESKGTWRKWVSNNCQPNFRQNVHPDPEKSCGPYFPKTSGPMNNSIGHSVTKRGAKDGLSISTHDTVCMIAVDQNASIAAATSTNGAPHKLPGRVADSSIPGAGAYVDNDYGAAASTGDGDVVLRFSSSYQTVENMRNGMHPTAAAMEAVHRIVKYYPEFKGAIIAANTKGEFGAACHKLDDFGIAVRNPSFSSVQVFNITCLV